jgi:hypothetical protein
MRMSKDRRHQQPIPTRSQAAAPPPPAAPPVLPLGYDPKGKMELVDVVSSKEGWSEFTLSDGSVIRLKSVLLEVKRAVGQYTIEGDPIYVMQSAQVNQVKAPEELRKKD